MHQESLGALEPGGREPSCPRYSDRGGGGGSRGQAIAVLTNVCLPFITKALQLLETFTLNVIFVLRVGFKSGRNYGLW